MLTRFREEAFGIGLKRHPFFILGKDTGRLVEHRAAIDDLLLRESPDKISAVSAFVQNRSRQSGTPEIGYGFGRVCFLDLLPEVKGVRECQSNERHQDCKDDAIR
jgi:hypothetical protein